tara:strand:- start:1787 stop:2842 length:1056 start_codon:yes stop_codon:yes gene_type:complete
MIKAEILADSINQQKDRITTMKVVIPRIVLAEFNTHRMFSRNSASSRAIPTSKMLEMIEENPFVPIAWQKDHKGMQGTQYLTGFDKDQCEYEWKEARDSAVEQAVKLKALGTTKQIINRLLEPFMWHTVIVTATEFENFFKLRCPQYDLGDGIFHRSRKDAYKYISENNLDKFGGMFISELDWLYANKSQAEIHIQAAAEAMWNAMNESTPKELQPGEWHIPYGDDIDDMLLCDYIEDTYSITPMDFVNYPKHFNETRIQIAVARCARLSYQTLGDNPEVNYANDIKLHDRLAAMEHWSPFEHVAKAMSEREYNSNIKGYYNTDSFTESIKSLGHHRNFKGFIQYRGTMDN